MFLWMPHQPSQEVYMISDFETDILTIAGASKHSTNPGNNWPPDASTGLLK